MLDPSPSEAATHATYQTERRPSYIVPRRPRNDRASRDIASFCRHLAARNLSPRTERTYTDAVVPLDGFLACEGQARRDPDRHVARPTH
jgi:hypothetical protein